MPRVHDIGKEKMEEDTYRQKKPELYSVIDDMTPVERAVFYEVGHRLAGGKKKHMPLGALISSARTDKRKDVEKVIKKLYRKGLVTKKRGKDIFLTDTGFHVYHAFEITGKEKELRETYRVRFRSGKKKAKS